MPLSVATPADFLLPRDACSYGYFLLEPNFWDPTTAIFRRVLELERGAVTLSISQRGKGKPLSIRTDRTLSARERNAARDQVSRMLRLNEDAKEIRGFHALDPRWRASGRGRVCRSPTFFEDVLKTVTSCNVTWPSTVSMNRRLCEHFGARAPSGLRAFPSARTIARLRPATLRARCGVGYRDARIVELARMFVKGSLAGVPTERFEDPATPADTLREWLLELPGIGPYAAANILQLLGRYGHLPLDTESVRHGRTVLGMKGPSPRIMKRVAAHFAPFGPHAFRSYWFEMWTYYESKRGKSWTWEREKTASTFTASKL
ncbi:MAG: DNA-3-methyladenine glycosylase family protein [Phycisphaerales bacterium]